ncbi:MAG: CTP synthase [Candidatus Acididesulfobacter guangdongensis]|uniref:CTP synthase n=1 Tax=Acididesulfobacter guangdongensis TaxID=2597225 RepID=A0A519BGE7_ACIG2|nr:MAG: CTP synthase [Candidatus Acididesulfobacter guangdongensis]
MNSKTKYIFVTGGVVSSLGKGIASSSIGALLEARGLSITIQKLDPYINVDPGTMNPFQHGEVFVTDDGAETDLDLGHYERFTSLSLTKINNFTSGQVYDAVINNERKGIYLGKTVQVIPHITDQIKKNIIKVSEKKDVAIIEIGGTVGDIESLPFLEAIRQFKLDKGRENVLYIHLTLVPYISTADELKTKPTQHSVKELRAIGIEPNIIICRADRLLPDDIRAKIALFCNVEQDAVITAKDEKSIYDVPLSLHKERLDAKIIEYLNIWAKSPDLSAWSKISNGFKNVKGSVQIGIIGKYVDLKESYKSLNESLIHGGLANNVSVDIIYFNSEDFEGDADKVKESLNKLSCCGGILVPGGFGSRGIAGMVNAITYARENDIPYFGICLGMQLMTVEYARNVLGLNDADSLEFNENTPNPVISLMENQKNIGKMGGTMRLGAYPCVLKKNTLAYNIYYKNSKKTNSENNKNLVKTNLDGSVYISERHRHRFEFNNKYKDVFNDGKFVFSGLSPDGRLVEICELADRKWFLGCQFHPEFKSSPLSPHPLFKEFVAVAVKYKKK